VNVSIVTLNVSDTGLVIFSEQELAQKCDFLKKKCVNLIIMFFLFFFQSLTYFSLTVILERLGSKIL